MEKKEEEMVKEVICRLCGVKVEKGEGRHSFEGYIHQGEGPAAQYGKENPEIENGWDHPPNPGVRNEEWWNGWNTAVEAFQVSLGESDYAYEITDNAYNWAGVGRDDDEEDLEDWRNE